MCKSCDLGSLFGLQCFEPNKDRKKMKRSGRTKCKCNPIMRSERTIKQTNKPFNKLAMLENTGDYAREEYANHEQTIVAILVPSLLPPDYDEKKNIRRNFATLGNTDDFAHVT